MRCAPDSCSSCWARSSSRSWMRTVRSSPNRRGVSGREPHAHLGGEPVPPAHALARAHRRPGRRSVRGCGEQHPALEPRAADRRRGRAQPVAVALPGRAERAPAQRADGAHERGRCRAVSAFEREPVLPAHALDRQRRGRSARAWQVAAALPRPRRDDDGEHPGSGRRGGAAPVARAADDRGAGRGMGGAPGAVPAVGVLRGARGAHRVAARAAPAPGERARIRARRNGRMTIEGRYRAAHRPSYALAAVDLLAQALAVRGPIAPPTCPLSCAIVEQLAPVARTFTPPLMLELRQSANGSVLFDGRYRVGDGPLRDVPLGDGQYTAELRGDYYRPQRFTL